MAKAKDPEIEIKARMSGSDKWKDWSKYKGKNKSRGKSGGGGALYFFGFIGAAVYFVQNAIGFVAVITGVLKAMIWPAIIVYKLLEHLYVLSF